MKLEVGQILFIEKPSHRGGPSIYEGEVISIGRKYFNVKTGYGERRFRLETMYEDSVSNYMGRAYLTRQEIEDKNEANSLYDKLRKAFDWGSRGKYTLEQLRKVAQVLNIIEAESLVGVLDLSNTEHNVQASVATKDDSNSKDD